MKKKTIFSLICCLLVIFGLTGCGLGTSSKDDSKDYNITIKEIDGIDVKAYISSGQNQLIVSATNNSGKTIGSGYIKVNYYDENNNKITIYGTDDTRYNMFENEKEIVFGFELPTENNVNYYIPARTEVEVSIDEEYQNNYSHIIDKYVENFNYSYSTDDQAITLSLKNTSTSEDTAPRSVSVVFYKNNKPVYSKDISFIFKKVNAGETTTSVFDIPTDYKKSKETGQSVLLDYDSIKIFRIVEGIS